MSEQIAIKISSLGKKYLIGHNLDRGRPKTFREALTNGFKNALMSARNMAHLRQLVSGDEVEEFWALKDLSLEINQGEVVGVVGKNGAGKSTLLKILSRITEPTSGSARIRGRVASLLEVGTGFHPELTGRENIYLNAAILGMGRREVRQKVDEIIAFSGTERFIDTPVKRYSSGMQVRLAFSVAAHLDPEVLIIDEVLAVGDRDFQDKCLGRMQDVARSGRTVLFVSHNLNAVRALCTRAILLEGGHLTMDGDVPAVLKHYAERSDRNEQQDNRGRAELENGPLETVEVSVRTKQGDPHLSPGAAAQISISCRTREEITRASFVITIATQDGIQLFRTSSGSMWNMHFDSKGGRACAEVCLDRLDLIPGEYLVGLAVVQADGKIAFDDPGFCQINIRDLPHGKAITPLRYPANVPVWFQHKWVS